jgi:hypothetical protein
MAMSGPIEEGIAELIARTRQQNERYASAHYRGPNQTGSTGLGNRLEALEQALVMLAREVDAIRDGSAAGNHPSEHAD